MHDEPSLTGHKLNFPLHLMQRKWTGLATVLALSASLFVASPSFGAGNATLDVDTQNDTFRNSGEITGKQTVTGGAGNQNVGQDVFAPVLAFRATYRSKNNTFENTGKIRGDQQVTGGVGNQNVGQRVVQ